MKTTPIIVQLSESVEHLYRHVEAIVHHLDAEQYVHASAEIGHLQGVAERVAGLCWLARESVVEDEWLARHAEKASRPADGGAA